ncbi:MAG: 3D domain-containing protein [Eubacterium sp.]
MAFSQNDQIQGLKKAGNMIKRFIKKYFYYLLLVFIFLVGLLIGIIIKPIDLSASQEEIFVPKSEAINLNCTCTDWIDFTATAYCACDKCCGKSDGITASGVKAKQGVTIASDWNVLPNGTIVEIDGIGTYEVQDKGGAIKGNKIDIYFDSHADAVQFGVRTVQLKVIDCKS